MFADRSFISTTDLVLSVSNAIDLITPLFLDHHRRVCFASLAIGDVMQLSVPRMEQLFIAASLHDIGSLNLQSRMNTLQFDYSPSTGVGHATIGARMLCTFSPFAEAARIVEHHHDRYSDSWTFDTPVESSIIHLADRVDVLLRQYDHPLESVPKITADILAEAGDLFDPQVCDAFMELVNRECFWLDMTSHHTEFLLREKARPISMTFELEGMQEFAAMVSRIIDFRSSFTATHSRGVAAVACALGKAAGFSEDECRMLKISGYLHDLGKLAVPAEIIDKNAPLTAGEFNLIKSHTYHTYRILEPIGPLRTINTWASLHHEKLDGSGYPFHLHADQIPLGSRILAVADVFTAVSEDRPYRKGMSKRDVRELLWKLAHKQHLDRRVVGELLADYERINNCRIQEQFSVEQEYAEQIQWAV